MKTLRSSAQRALLNLLRDVRKEAGLTQRQLAARLKTQQATIWKIETGERYIDPMECAAWAKACRVGARDFFNRFADALERKI